LPLPLQIRIVKQMKTLQNAADKQEILARLKRLHPNSARRWGKMSPAQMICHVSDGMRMYMGERPVALARVPYPRALMRWIALWAPIPWPHGFQTVPELDQQSGGTPPEHFEQDVEELRVLIDRFTRERFDFRWPHPHFAKMSEREWMRLAYLHADHHLRQFGC
jgi:hypothetical protein